MTEKGNEKIMRATGLIVIEVRNSNPNGDPDKGSDPRYRPDDHGEISPVSFKRKIRDLIEEKEGVFWNSIKPQFKPQLKDEEFEILESRDRGFRNVKDASEAWKKVVEMIDEDDKHNVKMKNRYWDARVFGSTFLEKDEKAPKGTKEEGGKPKVSKKKKDKKYIKTGIAQFGLGISVAPIEIIRETLTKKSSAQEQKDRGMAPLGYRVVQHGVYCMPFFVNPAYAHKSGCMKRDIDLLLKIIPFAYSNNQSMPRNMIEIRHAWYMEHKNPLGSCSDFALIDALTPKKKGDPEKASSSWGEYEIPTMLPKELLDRISSCKDLMTNI